MLFHGKSINVNSYADTTQYISLNNNTIKKYYKVLQISQQHQEYIHVKVEYDGHDANYCYSSVQSCGHHRTNRVASKMYMSRNI